MSDRKLSNWIKGFLQYTENTEPPETFRKWVAISCIAAALQRKVRLEWGTALTFYPNFYIVLVGPSATGKGTAMTPGLKILQEVQNVRLASQATSLQALIKHLKNTNLTDIDPETGNHQFHSSLTIFSKEFTVFLGYQNRELMAALCDWYDCDNKWSYETISRSREEITGVWVNLIGGTTPDLIRSSLPIESIGGGLTSRIIFIYEEKPGKLVTLPTETKHERELYQLLVEDLNKISLLAGQFRWTPEFAVEWDKWCRHAVENPPFTDPKFDGYIGRRRVHLLKLSMVLSVSKNKSPALSLDIYDLQDAIEILYEAETKMQYVFKGFGRSGIAEYMHRLSTMLMTSTVDEIPIYQIARFLGDDVDKFTLDRVLTTMETLKRIKIVNRPGADSYIKIIDKSALKDG